MDLLLCLVMSLPCQIPPIVTLEFDYGVKVTILPGRQVLIQDGNWLADGYRMPDGTIHVIWMFKEEDSYMPWGSGVYSFQPDGSLVGSYGALLTESGKRQSFSRYQRR